MMIFLKLYYFQYFFIWRIIIHRQKNHKANISYLNPFLSLKLPFFLRHFRTGIFLKILAQNAVYILNKRVCRTVYPSPCLHTEDTSTDTPYVSHHLCFNLWNSINQKNLQFFCSSSDMFQVLFSSQDNLFFDGILLSYNCELHFALSCMDKTMRILFLKEEFLFIYNMS